MPTEKRTFIALIDLVGLFGRSIEAKEQDIRAAIDELVELHHHQAAQNLFGHARALLSRFLHPKRQPQPLLHQFARLYFISQAGVALQTYLLALHRAHCSPQTIKGYRSDIGQFIAFIQQSSLTQILTKPKLLSFLENSLFQGQSISTVKRKLSSITQFALWLQKEGFVEHGFSEIVALNAQAEPHLTRMASGLKTKKLPKTPKQTPSANKKQLWQLPLLTLDHNFTSSVSTRSNQDWQYQLNSALSRLHSASRAPSLNYTTLAIVALLFSALGLFGYQQWLDSATPSLAYPTELTRPYRSLSFQGRLTDIAKTPIIDPTPVRFYLYDTGPGTGGSLLWDSGGTCSVDPDQDGIFSIGLGDECGAEIGNEVFTENSNVWLEVEVDAEVLTPRQAIKSVAYALNSETLQGYPPAPTGGATKNTVLVMDNAGQILIAESNSILKSTGTSFTIEAATLTLQTPAGSNGDIVLDPDGIGKVEINSDLDVEGYLSAPGATLSATYAGGTALILKAGPSATADIAQWKTSTDTTLGVINSAGNLGIGTSNPVEKLDVSGNLRFSGALMPGGQSGTSGYYLQSQGANTAPVWTDMSSTLLPTGISGQTLRHDGTSWTANSLLFNDGTNVGIGTTAPAQKLEVVGDVRITGLTASLPVKTNANKDLISAAINLASSEVTGALGVSNGGTGQNWSSVVRGSIPFFNNTGTMTTLAPSTAGYVLSTNGAGADPTWIEMTATGETYWTLANQGLHALNTTLNLYVGGDSTATAKFRADADTGTGHFMGNVGIGTYNPAARLHIAGAASTIANDDGDITITPAEDLVILPTTGNVGIGTASPAQKLEVVGDVRITGLTASLPVKTNTSKDLISGAINLASAEVTGTLGVGNGGTNATTVGSAGSVAYSTGTAYGFSSVGTTGYLLTSAGTGTPTWTDPTTVGTNYWTLANQGLSPTNQSLNLYVGGNSTASAKFRADANTGAGHFMGNVGIGTTAPQYKLDVTGGQVRFQDGMLSPYDHAVVVDPDGEGDFTTISAAMTYVSTQSPAPDNRFLVEVLPGTYTENVLVPAYTTLKSRAGNVVINGDGTAGTGINYIVNLSGSGSSIEDIQISNTTNIKDIGSVAAITVGAGSGTSGNIIRDVSISVSSTTGSGSLYGIFSSNASLSIFDSNVSVRGDYKDAVGIYNNWQTISIERTTVSSVGYFTGTRYGLYVPGAYTVNAKNSYFGGSDYDISTGGVANLYYSYLTNNTTSGTVNQYPQASASRYGLIKFNGIWTSDDFTLQSNTATDNALILKGAASQTANIFQIQDSTSQSLFVVNPLGNVGIGSTAPTQKLDIAGNLQFSGALMPGGLAGTSGYYLQSQGANVAPVWTNLSSVLLPTGTSGQTLRHDGTSWIANSLLHNDGTNVGIGTTVPAQKLDIAGNLQFSGAIMPGAAAGTSGYLLTSAGTNTAPTWTDPTTVGTNYWTLANQGLSPTNQSLNLYIGGNSTASAKFRADANTGAGHFMGNVGIGTTIAGSNLDVAGSAPSILIRASLDSSNGVKITGAASGLSAIIANQRSDGPIYFNQTTTTRLAISSTGNVGIGTTAPAQKLEVAGDVRVTGLTASLPVKTNANKDLISEAINLGSTEVTGTLGVGYGGTGATTVGSAGTIAYSTGTAYGFSSVGTTGYLLTSAGSGTPTWTDPTTVGTNYWTLANQGLSPTNQSLNLYIGGNSTASAKFRADANTGAGHFMGNVGIGTTSPSVILNVTNGPSLATMAKFEGNSAILELTRGAIDRIAGIQYTGASASWFSGVFYGGAQYSYGIGTDYNAANQKFVINTTGNVGIGTTAPAQKLDIAGNLQFSNALMPGGLAGTSGYYLQSQGANTAPVWTNLSSVLLPTGTSGQTLRHDGTSWIANSLLYNNGTNVGIGTTNPISFVDILAGTGGSLRIRDSANRSLLFTTYDGTNPATISTANTVSGLLLKSQDGGNQIFLANSGNVGIGTITPAQKLEVAGDVRVTGLTASLPVKTNANKDLISAAINLASAEVTGTLGVGNGGTNATTVGSAGTIAYSTGTAYGFSSVGTTGYLLTSAGSGTPTWTDPSTITGTNYWTLANQGLSATNQSLNLYVGGDATATAKFMADGATGQGYFAGNVGIGTTTPSQKLDVSGAIRLGAAGANNVLNTSAAAGAASSSLYWGDKMVCDASGNCGPSSNWTVNAGTISPNNTSLDMLIGGTASSSAKFAFLNVNSGTPTASISGNLALAVPTGANPATKLNILNGGTFGIRTSTGGDAGLTERFTILNNGNVGIGSTSPLSFFDVNSLFNVTSAGNVGIGSTAPNAKLNIVSTNTTSLLNLTGDSITSGNGINVSLDGLTTGNGLYFESTSTALTTGNLAYLNWNPSGSTEVYATGDLFKLNVGQYGNIGKILGIYNNDSEVFSVAQNQITSAVPHQFTAAGDVSMAYDLIFTNQTSSNIQTYGPFSITVGEAWESNNLTLKTYGAGDIIANLSGTGNFLVPTGNVGVGSTAPAQKLDVVGNVQFSGAIMPGSSAGTSGYLLTSAGAGATPTWTDPSTITGTSYWTLANQGLHATNTTLNLYVGGNSTASAKFMADGATGAGYFAGNLGIGTTAPGAMLQLGTAGTSRGTLRLTGNTSGYTQIQPAEAAGDWTLTLPANDGDLNQMLTTDGSGNTSWTTISTGSTTWDAIQSPVGAQSLTMGANTSTWTWNSLTTGTGLTSSSTSLTSGTMFSLSTSSTALSSGGLLNLSATGAPASTWTGDLAKFEYNNADADVDGSALKVGLLGTDALGSGTALNITTSQTGTGALALRVNDDGTYADTTPFVVDMGGNVGVGTTSPGAYLDIYADTMVSGGKAVSVSQIGSIDSQTRYGIYSTATGGGINTSTNVAGYFSATGAVKNYGLIVDSGNVGIGSTAPAQKLDIVGNLQFSGAIMPGAAAGTSGYLLTSAGANTAPTWTDPTTVGTNYWTLANQGLHPTNTTLNLYVGGNSTASAKFRADANTGAGHFMGNVGIGTTVPTQKLEVVGNALVNNTLYMLDINHSIRAVSGQGVYIDTYGVIDPFFVQQVSGNVGIGTTAPAFKLNLAAATTAVGGIGFGSDTNLYRSAADTLKTDDNLVVGTLGAGSTDTVVTHSSGTLQTRSIDTRVWGTSLVDGSGTNGYNAYWSPDSNTLAAEQYVNVTRGGLGANMTAGGAGEIIYSTGTAAYGHLTAGTSGMALISGGAAAPTWGTLSTTYGGTGQNWSAVARGSVPFFNNTGAMSTLAPSTAGYVLSTNGAGADPTWIEMTATGGGSYWSLANQGLYPTNTTLNLYIGGNSTASAKFRADADTGTGHFTGNLGIGTTNPTARLHIAGAASTIANSTGNITITPAANLIMAPTAGNVGIGSTNPTQKLDIAGNLQFSGAIMPGAAAGTSGYLLTSAGANTAPTWTDPTTVGTNYWTLANQGLSPTNQSLNLYIGGNSTASAKFRADANTGTGHFMGNVGIGTTSPTYKLTVDSGYIGLSDGYGVSWGTSTIYGYQNSLIGFQTAGSEKMRLSATGGLSLGNGYIVTDPGAGSMIVSGNVGIGTTAPSAMLQLGTAGTSRGTLRLTGNTSGYTQIQPAEAAGDWTLTLPANDGDLNQMLTTDGSGNTSWTTISTGSTTWDAIQSPVGAQSLTMGANTSTWTWNSLTTGTGLTSSSTSLTSGTMFSLARSGAGLTTGGKLLNIDMGAATAGNGATIATTGIYTGTGLLTLTANSATTGTLSSISGTALTSGTALSITAGGTGLTGNALYVTSPSTSAFSNGGVRFNFTGAHTGNGFQLDDATATGNAMAINVNSLTTGKGLAISSSTLSSGSLLDLVTTSTAATGSTQKGLNISLSGTNVTSAQTTYGAYITNTHAGTTSTNVGLYASATGGTTANYAAIFANGNVGIGTTSPSAKLRVVGGYSDISDSGTPPSSGAFGTAMGHLSGSYGWIQTYGSTPLILNPLASNVGIGTTAPSYKLDVVGNGQFIYGSNGNALRLGGVSSGLDFNVYNSYAILTTEASNQALALQTNGGNVGIGTTSPGNKLAISGSSTGSIGAFIDNTNTAGYGVLRINSGNADAAVGAALHSIGSTYSGSGAYAPLTTALVGYDSGGLSLTANNAAGVISMFTAGSAAGNERLRISANGNVGIGTTTPSAKLHINGDLKLATGANVNYIATTVGATGDDTTLVTEQGIREAINAGGPIGGGWTDDGSVVRLTTVGDLVGIGTTSPGGKLDIADGQLALILGADSGASTRTNATQKWGRFGGYHYTNAEEPVAIATTQSENGYNILHFGGGTPAMNATTYMLFYTAANGTTTTGTERMRIDSAGNVGIGTTNPLQKLDVDGNIQIASANESTDPVLFLSDRDSLTTEGLKFTYDNSTGASYIDNLYNNDNGDIFIRTKTAVAPINALTIKGNGNVGIGTTNPNAKLRVQDALASGAYGFGAIFQTRLTGTATAGVGLISDYQTTSTTASTTTAGALQASQMSAITTGTQYTIGGQFSGWSSGVNGATTHSIGGRFQAGGNVTSGTINAYGVYIQNALSMNLTGTSTNYGLYVETPTGADTNVAAYFGGNVGIETTNPNNFKLQVSGDIGGQTNNTSKLGSSAIRFANIYSVLGNYSGQITSSLAVGTSPFAVTSTTLNTNLNADLLDNQHGSYYMPASTDNWVNITGDTMTGTLNFSGVASDITTATNEHLSLMPAGTGNVGIGITNPLGKLQITGDEVRIGSGGTINSATGDGDLYVQDALEVDGDTALRNTIVIGNVGIKTSSVLSGVNLQLGGNSPAGVFYLKTTSNSNGANLGEIAFGGLDSGFAEQEYASMNANIVSSTAGSEIGRLDFNTFAGGSDATRLSISGDNVGIGTTAPASKLNIVTSLDGSSYTANLTNTSTGTSASNFLQFGNNASSDLFLVGLRGSAYTGEGNDALIWNRAGSNIRFGTNNSLKMILTASGNLGIGTTTGAGQKLEIYGGNLKINANNAGILGGATNTSTAGFIYMAALDDDKMFRFWTDSATAQYNTAEGGGWSSASFDYAEKFPYVNETSVSKGDLVSVVANDGVIETLDRASRQYDENLVGIVSTQPGFIGGIPWDDSEGENKKSPNLEKAVALAGRVPVKVSTINGPLKTGDRVTSSNLPGIGMRSSQAGFSAGYVLQNFNPDPASCQYVASAEGILWPDFPKGGSPLEYTKDCYRLPDGTLIGKVIAFVNPGWFDPDTSLTSVSQLSLSHTADSSYDVYDPSGQKINRVSAFSQSMIGELTAGLVLSKEIFVEDKLVSPIVESNQIITDQLASRNITTNSLEFKGDTGKILASVDATGKASFTEAVINRVSIPTQALISNLVANSISATNVAADALSVGGKSLSIYVREIVDEALANTSGLIASIPEILQLSDLVVNRRAEINELEVNTLAINQIPIDQYLDERIAQRLSAVSPTPTPSVTDPVSFDPTQPTLLGELNAQEVTVSGGLSASSVTTTTVDTQNLVADSGSFELELKATDLEATAARFDVIESNLAKIDEVTALTASLANATVSGTLYVENIADLDQHIAEAFTQPSLSELFFNEKSEITQELDQINQLIASLDSTVQELSSFDKSLEELSLTEEEVVLNGSALFIEEYFRVNGTGYIAESLGIGQQLNIGNKVQLTENYLAFTANPEAEGELAIFQIQPSGKGVLSIMAGLMTLDETGLVNITGNLHVAGDITTEGSLLSNLLQPVDFGNPFQVQVAGASSESGELKNSRFEIVDATGAPVATISAQGRAEFAGGIGIGSEDLSDQSASASADTVINTDKTSGKAVLPAGQSLLVIETSAITDKSLVYITPLGSTQNQVLYVASQQPDQEIITEATEEKPEETVIIPGHFSVAVDQALDTDLQFNWWIVN